MFQRLENTMKYYINTFQVNVHSENAYSNSNRNPV